MKTIVIVSDKDEAGLNIKQALLSSESFRTENLIVTEKDSIYFDECNSIDADILIFATRHSSKNGMPALSCHVSGNWGKAELGGEDRKMSVAPALLLRDALLLLDSFKDVEVFQEVTHHGPLVEKPSLFIEIGSAEEEWRKEENGKRIAEVIIKLMQKLENYDSYDDYLADNKDVKIALALGGLHHTPTFKRRILEENIALGHACPKYNLANFDEHMLEEAVLKTREKVDLVLVDWKGLGEHKQRIKDILDKSGIEWKRI